MQPKLICYAVSLFNLECFNEQLILDSNLESYYLHYLSEKYYTCDSIDTRMGLLLLDEDAVQDELPMTHGKH